MLIRRLSLLLLLLAVTSSLGCHRRHASGVARPAPPNPNYNLGQLVSFGRGGGADRYKRGGWGDTERDFTWTNGRVATLVFVVPDTKTPLRLRMRLAGFIDPPQISAQPVAVYINDEYMADWDVAQIDDFFAIIPPEVANHEQFIVELRMPKAISPKVLGIGEDPRTLGVSCFNLEIGETTSSEALKAEEERERRRAEAHANNSYSLGDVIRFGAGENARRYEVSGWYPAEDNFTWAGKAPAVLELKTTPTSRPLTLKMRLAGNIAPRTLPAQVVDLMVNQQKIASWTVSGVSDFEATIPSEITARADGKFNIELQTASAASPRSLGLGDDKRVLGVRCEGMVLDEFQPNSSRPTEASPHSR